MVFPNPTAGSVALQVSVDLIGGRALLIDTRGSIVRSEPISASRIKVDLSGLPPQVLVLRIETASGVLVGSQRVVVQ